MEEIIKKFGIEKVLPPNIEIDHYDLLYGVSHDKARLRFEEVVASILDPKLLPKVLQHFEYACSFFSKETDLYYHNKHHAVYQAGYDAVKITKGLLAREDYLSGCLSTEGVLAIILGTLYHDSGYMTAEENPEKHSRLTPVHVEASKITFTKAIDQFGLPDSLDKEKIKRLGIIGIHNTYFPFTAERKLELKKILEGMSIAERKEAVIVGLAVQLADLGGQVARVDYYPDLLKALRKEMDSASEGLGTKIIGEDHELLEKCRGFIKGVVYPTVGKTANAFLGKENSFQKAWIRLISINHLS